MTIINDTRVVRLQRVAARTGHQHSADERIVEHVVDELVTSADVVALPQGSLITLQRGPGSGHTEEGSVLNATFNDIGGVDSGQTSSVSFDSEDAGATAAAIFVTEIDFSLSPSSSGEYAVNYKTFQVKTYDTVPTTPGSRILVSYTWAPIREYLEWNPEDLDPDLLAFGIGPHAQGATGANVIDGYNINIVELQDGYKEISVDIYSLAGFGLTVDETGIEPILNVDLDAYHVPYDDSANHIIFADNVQDAITEIDGYISVGEVFQFRQLGNEALDYPSNTIFSTGAVYPLGSKRLLVWVNGIPLFAPDDYSESGVSTITTTSSIEDDDIVDIWVLPRYLGVRDHLTLTLQEVYDNTNVLQKYINTTYEGLSLLHSASIGSVLSLSTSDTVAPSLVITQDGTGEGARIKSIDETKSSLLVQKDTSSRNTNSDTIIVERTTSSVLGGQTGMGSSFLTRLENSGTMLFDASRIKTGTESVLDSAENTYMSFGLATDGVLTDHMYLTSDGSLGVGTSSPSAVLHVVGDGYFNDKLTVSGDAVFKSNVNITNSNPPATASAIGTAGDIAWDSNYLYICVATNTWKRVALSTWA